MSLEQELDRAIEIAAGMAADGETLAAVMPAEPDTGRLVYLAAYERGEHISYALLDSHGTVVGERRRVGDAVTVIALAERAEEAAAATAADDLRLVFADLTELLRSVDPEASQAAAAVAEAAAATAEAAAGPRAASPGYLDRIAQVAGPLGETFAVFEQHAEALAATAATDPAMAEPAAAAWQAMALAARSGDPAGLAQAMTATAGVVDALVDDVLEHYRVDLA